jgi:hypothetical protein
MEITREASTTGWPRFLTRSRKETFAAWLFIFPDCIGLLVFVAIPMMLALSFRFFSVDGFGGYKFVGQDLAQCNLVLCSVVKFGCSRGLVSRHLQGVLQPSVVLQVNGDPGCPPGVTSNGGEKAGCLGPFSNRSPGVVPVKSSSGYCCSSRINALEQRLAAPKACCLRGRDQYKAKIVIFRLRAT